jgi:hypothetical protein
MPFRFHRRIGLRWLKLIVSKTGLSVSYQPAGRGCMSTATSRIAARTRGGGPQDRAGSAGSTIMPLNLARG